LGNLGRQYYCPLDCVTINSEHQQTSEPEEKS
jgi:hypothetical protein